MIRRENWGTSTVPFIEVQFDDRMSVLTSCDPRIRLGDVIFGETAINYEEGKMEAVDGQLVSRPDYNRVAVHSGDMQAFAESKERPKLHYGEYISGSAVRGDADVVFEKIRSSVRHELWVRFTT